MIRALAIDIDGTFLGNNREFLHENVEILRMLLTKGIVPIFASGRTTVSTRKISRAICRRSLPFVAFNGAVLAVGSRKPVNIKFVGNLAAKIVERLLDKGIYVQAFINDNVFASEMSSAAVDYAIRAGIEITVRKRLHRVVSIAPPTKITAKCDENGFPELLSELKGEFGEAQFITVRPGHIEIFPLGVSKLEALKTFCSCSGIALSEIAAFGDGLLDIEMLVSAGIGVAMGNASEEVIRAADIVAPRNDECGFCVAVRQLIENGCICFS